MQLCVSDAALHPFRFGTADSLFGCLAAQVLHHSVGVVALGILPSEDVAVLHVAEHFETGHPKEVDVARLGVLFRYGPVEAVQGSGVSIR